MKNDYLDISDSELAQVVATSGDRGQFDEIVRRHYQPLTMFAISKTANFQDAEDIVQETFFRAYKNITSFNGKYSMKNWLFTIAYRLIISDYRKKKPQRLSEEAASNIESNQPDTKSNQWLWDVAKDLGPDSFTVLWLRYKEDMTTDEISKIMNKTKTTVRVLLHRSRIRLAKQIANKPQIAEQSQWLRDRNVLLERTKQ